MKRKTREDRNALGRISSLNIRLENEKKEKKRKKCRWSNLGLPVNGPVLIKSHFCMRNGEQTTLQIVMCSVIWCSD